MKFIPLTQGKTTIVDDEDYPILSKFTWYAHNDRGSFYARRNGPMKNRHRVVIPMHRFIMNPPKGLQIDHINGDTLDNRKENLRIVTIRQNQQNQHKPKSSKYPGVSISKNEKKWKSSIVINGKQRYLGGYENEIDAATVYRVACKVLLEDDSAKHIGAMPCESGVR